MRLGLLSAATLISFISERDGNREVYVIEANGKNERRITRSKDTADYNGPLSPDGKELLVTSVETSDAGRPQRFFLYPLDGRPPRPLGPPRSLLRSPVFSSDGRFLFFEGSSTGFREIFRMALDGKTPRPLTSNREGNFQPCLSPDGKTLAFVSSRDQVAELYLTDTNGRSPRRITRTERDEWQPVWSPDGKFLLFASDRDGADRLYLQSKDGSTARRLTTEELDPTVVEESASFSPDGKSVLYVRRQPGQPAKLALVSVAGSRRTFLAENQTGPVSEPAFSPDGTQVVFTLGFPDKSGLFLVGSDGKSVRRLTGPDGPNWHPLWHNKAATEPTAHLRGR